MMELYIKALLVVANKQVDIIIRLVGIRFDRTCLAGSSLGLCTALRGIYGSIRKVGRAFLSTRKVDVGTFGYNDDRSYLYLR